MTREIINAYKAQLHRRAMRYGKTPSGAFRWLEKHYTGNSKNAMRHQMDCGIGHTIGELELRNFYRAIIRQQRKEG